MFCRKHNLKGNHLFSFATSLLPAWFRNNRPHSDADRLYIFCVTEDCGADQKAQRQKLLSFFSEHIDVENPEDDDMWNCWFWDMDCLVHQFHLIVASQLTLMDSCLRFLEQTFTYYSALAKMVYTWRNHSTEMMDRYEPDEFPSQQLPPAPCAARWGCVHEIEAFMVAAGCQNVASKFTSACEAIAARKSSKPLKPNKTQQLDEIALDEYKAFQIKMSKYMGAAVTAANSSIFWFFLLVSFTCKERLTECYAFLQKHGEFAIVHLVCEKAYAYGNKLRELVTNLDWVDFCLEASKANRLSEGQVQELVNAAIRIAANNCAAFERRIEEYVTACLGYTDTLDTGYSATNCLIVFEVWFLCSVEINI